ncbi:MAG: roadblock/LC7 domain-containing protein [Methanolinea sp.]|nr:roadblock/LC7 domain-containing protein [Methanolinea sp.]
MKIPDGAYLGSSDDPFRYLSGEEARPFSGRVEVLTAEGAGLLLVREGECIAACYREKDRELRGGDAITYLMQRKGEGRGEPRFIQYRYTPDEVAVAEKYCLNRGFSTQKKGISRPGPGGRIEEGALSRLVELPGVRAVLVFFEGFPIQSLGDMDPEQAAAAGEDFLRAARKMSRDIHVGEPQQVTLEGDRGIFIIIHDGDLSLCVMAEADAHLGLLRLALKSLQQKVTLGG